MARIKNGNYYPKSVKRAVSDELRIGTRSNKAIALAYNISVSTIGVWKREANAQGNTPSGLANHMAAAANIKAFNTPIVHYSDVAKTIVSHIEFRGVRFV